MRINTISLTDFRAFPGPSAATFQLDGKNLLVYGENGSGKSSLFHALRGFFDYQRPPSLLTLQNSFSNSGIGAVKVELAFDDTTSAAWSIVSGFSPNVPPWAVPFIGPVALDRHPGHDAPVSAEIRQAARFSACLDYRSLLNTNYKHDDREINLFELTVHGFLADFPDLATNKTLRDLWRAVLASKPSRNTTKAKTACVQRCAEFNNALTRALSLLEVETQKLLPLMSAEGVELKRFIFAPVQYNFAKKSEDKKFINQAIGIEIHFRSRAVDKPQNYLNEARLSALGLAFYLGGRLACAPQTTPHLKLLVLDDVLIGLDHSNRLPILDVLTQLFQNWQVVLLTHDTTWFDLARQHLPKPLWNCYEIYEGDSAAAAPMPVVRKTENKPARALLQKARELLALGYIEAAANYVRQAFETGIRVACELKHIKLNYKRDATEHKAQDLLNGLKGWSGTATVPKVDWDNAIHRLELFKDVVMNPYSHPSAPNIPRQEIVDSVTAVEQFLDLVATR